MECPKCQHENSFNAKFCEECAAPLMRRCVRCDGCVSFTAKFCPQCGYAQALDIAGNNRFGSLESYTPRHLAEKILISRAVFGERKHVTVLFADISGSMELLVGRDAEEVQKLLFDPVLERMMEAVHRYDGTVHRVMGDGVMALFGAPIAVEDHAVRACYAGLRMQQAITRYAEEVQRSHGVQLRIRVGVNSGEIVVRAIGNDLRMDFTVVGQTAHLANRMEQMAKPGSVLTTADTLRLAEGYVAVKPLGDVMVKGLADPVQVYEVTDVGPARTRLQAAAGHGLTRFVGRHTELEQLKRPQWLAGEGRGRVIAIVGEAGIGKSRLVHEFLRSQHTADWLILESTSASYSRLTPYLPVIELLRHYCKISIDDSPQSIREKVYDRILSLDLAVQESLPPLLDLLDALDDDHPFRSLDPPQHRHYTYQAVTRLLLGESCKQPVIIVIEDLHWHDPLSLGLLSELAAATQSARLLLVVTYRPEYRDDLRGFPNYHQLRLDPLTDHSLAELLQALLGSDPSLAAMKSLLAERATGNPFFIEEIARALADTGVIKGTRGRYFLATPFLDIEVPPTVRAVLAARIDALPIAEKCLLEAAAVIGYDVPFTLLLEICELTEDKVRGLLDSLQAAEFLYATQIFPSVQYAFKHSLTHDVAYSGVLYERRREIHARVVDATEKLYGDRVGEQVERLAHHALRGELREKAVHYIRLAASKAAARSALSDARAWFEQALGVLEALPDNQAALAQAFDIRLELRPVLRQLGEGRKMLEHLREAEALAERLQDDSRLGQACAAMTTVYSTLGELEEALATGGRALEIATRIGDLRVAIAAMLYLQQAYHYRGEYERVAACATDNLAALPADWVHERFGLTFSASVAGRVWVIMSLAELGRFAEAAKYEAEATRFAASSEHIFTICWAHFAASVMHFLHGDWEMARSRADRWITTLRNANVTMQLPWAVAASAWALAQLGNLKEAQDAIREAEELLVREAASGIFAYSGWAFCAVGRACLLLGLPDEAHRLADLALESSRQQPGFTAHALHLLGDTAIHPHRFDAEKGAAHYQNALILAQLHCMRPLVAHCHFGLGKLYRHIGETEHAGDNFAAASRMYREMEMDFWLHQTKAEMRDSKGIRLFGCEQSRETHD
jgi:class 3 adenylate cyclase/tetratricopeptide (TPR) repeat protein